MTDVRWQVAAAQKGFSATYLCETPESAAERVRYFQARSYDTIAITDPAGMTITADELHAMLEEILFATSDPATV